MSLLVCYSDSDSEEAPKAREPVSNEDFVASILEDMKTLSVIKREPSFCVDDYRGRGTESASDSDSVEEEGEEDSEGDEEEGTEVFGGAKSAIKDEDDSELWKGQKKWKKKAVSSLAEDGVKLPPIEDLHISVPEEACAKMGVVESIVDDLVVVRALPGVPAIDLDSVLFLDGGRRSLGRVFDVFGRVAQPFYSVRFNSADHIREKEVSVGEDVFCAPRTEHTAFVFVEQLRRMKGSDASWKNNDEPPDRYIDYSDDEEERSARRSRRAANRASGEWDEARAIQEGNRKRTAQGVCVSVSAHCNPFYRRNRHYNPRDYGPIRWNSVHTPSVGAYRASASGIHGGYTVPPPPTPAFAGQPHQGVIRPPVLWPFASPPPPPPTPNASTSSGSGPGAFPNPFASSCQNKNGQQLFDIFRHYPPPPPPPPPESQ